MSGATAPVPADFADFFSAVYGYEPFAWQSDLAARVLAGAGWPAAIDVPTGMGKTAVLDIAVYALACQSHLDPERRAAPTRTFIVVDRRVIVDQTFERARRLAQRLRQELHEPTHAVVHQAAQALQRLAGDGPPLAVVRMRGGVTWASRWLESPHQPAVVAGTVDQYGSRLLFRGYGVSAEARPIDAALCGADRLLFLDEAHLSAALVETAVKVGDYESKAERPILPARRPRPVVMSATLPRGTEDVHRLDPERETSVVARDRLLAEKRVVPINLLATARDPVTDMARTMAALAADALDDPVIERVGVVCNTVALARSTHHLVRERLSAADACLLIGRCREIDRQIVAENWGKQLIAQREREPRSRPLIAVATQTVEVGADFDFDVLITEASPLDSLLQRLGRLNRLGRAASATAIVLHSDRRHGSSDPIYGAATGHTWEWLTQRVGTVAESSAAGVASVACQAAGTDLGLLAARDALAAVEVESLVTPRPPSPVVLGPIIAAWARTHPVPDPDQPTGPFLHGVGRGLPQVQVCWRAGLPPSQDPQAAEVWSAEVDAVPVTSRETVEVPIWELRRFLAGSPAAGAAIADLEGLGGTDEENWLEEAPRVDAWIRRSDQLIRATGENVLPGDVVVVAAEAGGHDEWGWTGSPGPPVPDVADLAQRSPSLRLRPEILAALAGGTSDEWSSRLRSAVSMPTEERGVELDFDAIADAVLSSAGIPEQPYGGRLREVVRGLQSAGVVVSDRRDTRRASARIVGIEGMRWASVVGPAGRRNAGLRDTDGDQNEASSSVATRRVSLDEHLTDVGTRAAAFARCVGLPGPLVRALDLAGRAHDLGKADARFQAMLYEGFAERAETAGVVLAKSGMDSSNRRALHEARARARWPRGMRHEVLSARLLSAWIGADSHIVDGIDGEVVGHLVSTHHGRGRPLFPAMLDPDPRSVTAKPPGANDSITAEPDPMLVDWAAAARFARLNAKYGWWGLALLEACLRLADIACSAGYEGHGEA